MHTTRHGKRACSDYRHMPQLDAYDGEGIDDEAEGEAVSAGEAEAARQAAEAALDRRDRAAEGGLPGAFDGALLNPCPSQLWCGQW